MKVLLYNLQENIILKQTLNMMNIQCFNIASKDYNKPLSTLLGLSNSLIQDNDIDFKDEMMIMYDFSEEQLDALLSLLRMNQIKIALKAIVTEYNINWTSLQIRNELLQEHAAMNNKRNS